ncbi:MAG TPA: tetratricopeptide repeat protein [Bryobacteraceae bacterium]|nr:tetratricopeptide repeat protein [Bryobacteraceae bacterium]
MADKRKTPAIKKSGRGMEGTAAAGSSTASAVPHDAAGQRAAFEAAMKLFHLRELKEARALFARAMEGPERDVAQRAQVHSAMCDRRLQQFTPALNTAEDHYNYGVALINSRDVPKAREHLETAMRLAPGSDHIHYALGVAQALGGDLAGAHENVRRAIELEPRNRIIARHDADLAPLSGQPSFEALLYPEKKI